MQKSILVLSGGLDSSVSSHLAREVTLPVLALTFDYGQRAAAREQQASRKIAERLGVRHRVIKLPWLEEVTQSGLVNRTQPLPHLTATDLDNLDKGRASARAVWVPNRNGVFLNVAASFAESLGAELLVTGFNKEEAATFPDNSVSFVQAANGFFHFSTLNHVKVISYTAKMTKREIVAKGRELKIPFEEIWSCYEGGPSPCQVCESCLRLARALEGKS